MLQICIVHNDVLCVGTIAQDLPSLENSHQLATRYFMAQFWCEFTKEVLTEFLNEDFIIRTEMHNRKHNP